MTNPIPFNPEMMTVKQAKDVAEALRTAFDMIERKAEAEQIIGYLTTVREQMLKR